METKLSHQQSLEVIVEMIERSKNNLRQGDAGSMIYYGWVVAAIAIANFALLYLFPGSGRVFNIWWLMLPASIGGFLIDRRTDRSAIVRTQIDTFIGSVWRGYAVSCFAFLAVILTIAAHTGRWDIMSLCTPVILLMVGMAEYATARICRFRPFLAGAWGFWAGGLLCAPTILLGAGQWMFIILAACMLAGFVIPGHALNRKAASHV